MEMGMKVLEPGKITSLLREAVPQKTDHSLSSEKHVGVTKTGAAKKAGVVALGVLALAGVATMATPTTASAHDGPHPTYVGRVHHGYHNNNGADAFWGGFLGGLLGGMLMAPYGQAPYPYPNPYPYPAPVRGPYHYGPVSWSYYPEWHFHDPAGHMYGQ